jgi:predicted unusual protein kinase regulating ubiquinone biosynthesis (AarF/ABC1/UbiB family)
MGTNPPSDGITTGRLRRGAPVAGLVARTAGEAVVARLRRRDEPSPEEYARRAGRYVELLGRSKGALMKAGQLMSFVSFDSALPAENRALFQAAMSRLQTDAPPMDPELAADVIAHELGDRPEKVFAEFSPRPLAAASIGQVHAARLHDGSKVAVKVQYPGVADAITADLKNTELLAVMFQLLRSFIPGLTRTEPKEIAKEISARVLEEVDYRIEAAHQMRFAKAYRGHPYLHVPAVFPEYSTQRVLTQEYARGMAWREALHQPQELRDQWSEAIYRFAFGNIRRLHAFHADPHPGNYIFHEDGSVTFLDFGCVKQFSPDQASRMSKVIKAVYLNDGEALLRAFIDLGAFEAGHCPTPEAVMEWYVGPFQFLHQPQPFRATPEWLADMIAVQYSPTGPSGKVVRSVSTPAEFTFLSRIDMGVMSVLAELRATADWRAIVEEMDFDGPPATAMGRAEAEYWAARAGEVLT